MNGESLSENVVGTPSVRSENEFSSKVYTHRSLRENLFRKTESTPEKFVCRHLKNGDKFGLNQGRIVRHQMPPIGDHVTEVGGGEGGGDSFK